MADIIDFQQHHKEIVVYKEGVYEDMPVTRYCMDVDEVKISGPGMDTITEEMYV